MWGTGTATSSVWLPIRSSKTCAAFCFSPSATYVRTRPSRKRIPGSRLVEFPGVGHWPQLDDPDRFVAELSGFVESTEAYEFDLEHMREMLGRGPVARVAKA